MNQVHDLWPDIIATKEEAGRCLSELREYLEALVRSGDNAAEVRIWVQNPHKSMELAHGLWPSTIANRRDMRICLSDLRGYLEEIVLSRSKTRVELWVQKPLLKLAEVLEIGDESWD